MASVGSAAVQLWHQAPYPFDRVGGIPTRQGGDFIGCDIHFNQRPAMNLGTANIAGWKAIFQLDDDTSWPLAMDFLPRDFAADWRMKMIAKGHKDSSVYNHSTESDSAPKTSGGGGHRTRDWEYQLNLPWWPRGVIAHLHGLNGPWQPWTSAAMVGGRSIAKPRCQDLVRLPIPPFTECSGLAGLPITAFQVEKEGLGIGEPNGNEGRDWPTTNGLDQASSGHGAFGVCVVHRQTRHRSRAAPVPGSVGVTNERHQFGVKIRRADRHQSTRLTATPCATTRRTWQQMRAVFSGRSLFAGLTISITATKSLFSSVL